jgi:hypothetical protein
MLAIMVRMTVALHGMQSGGVVTPSFLVNLLYALTGV